MKLTFQCNTGVDSETVDITLTKPQERTFDAFVRQHGKMHVDVIL